MAGRETTFVRAFDGSLADAQGLLAVERAIFNESPYSARQVQAMLSEGPQRAWLAFGGNRVVGFVIAFVTAGLSGLCWELDLLAVAPAWRGRGLATDLLRAAMAGIPPGVERARAVVATDNSASLRAFGRVGFRPAAEICTLLVYRPQEAGLPPRSVFPVDIRQADEASPWPGDWAQGAGLSLVPASNSDRTALAFRPTVLQARSDGRPAGQAELIEVQTLLYRGAWIESLVAPRRPVREALATEAVRQGLAAGWDEVGAMVPEHDWPLKTTLLSLGFRSLGDYHWLLAGRRLSEAGYV